ncbi:MAG: diaminopimelate epimerase [Alphaproteobacteria bacterium]|nr:diaminopimelate epimerase [Alphaproteobacteria bacterium]
MIPFIKMHGLGNDFVILDQRAGRKPLEKEWVRKVCDRHFGVGCDQLIVLEPSDKADVFMRIYNPDASESAACGNATRCVADRLMGEKGNDRASIETLAGLLPCRRKGGFIEVDMGAPRLDWQDIPLAEARDTLHLQIEQDAVKDPVAVSMGNPHCVFFVDTVDGLPVETLGPYFEHHKLFPERTNVEFVQVMGRDRLRLRTWERGAGLTLACGSAACATIVAAVRRDFVDRKAEIVLDGGSLFMEWRASDGHVLMTGPASFVFEGVWSYDSYRCESSYH